MGWVLLGVTFFFTLDGLASPYAILDYRLHGGRLPLGWVAVLLAPSWAPAIVLAGPGRPGQVPSYRRSSAERRLQLKWLLTGGTAFIAAGITLVWIGNPTGPWRVAGFLAGAGTLALPVSIGSGILKLRLYDIDYIISRTLATRSSPGCWSGCTRAWCCSPPRCSGSTTRWPWPRPRWWPRRCSARSGGGCDADHTVTAFAARLQDAAELDTVRADLLAVVTTALEPADASLLIGSQKFH